MKRTSFSNTFMHRVMSILLVVCLIFTATPMQIQAEEDITQQSDGNDMDEGDAGDDDSDVESYDDDEQDEEDDNSGDEDEDSDVEDDSNSDDNQVSDGDNPSETPSFSDTEETIPTETPIETENEEETETETETDTEVNLLSELSIMPIDEEEYYDILANGQNAKLRSSNQFSGALEFVYGSGIDFSLAGYDGENDPDFYYLSSEDWKENINDTSWSSIRGTRTLKPGNYFIGYVVNIMDKDIELTGYDYGFVIKKGNVNKPSNLRWTNGSTASWDDSNTTEVFYKVTLYRDNVYINDVTISTKYYDFKDSPDFSVPGHYTFSVVAVPKDTECYEQSNEVKSTLKTSLVEVQTAAGDAGITQIVPNTTETNLLIAGNEYSTLTVSALVSEGRKFAKWTSSDEQIDIEDSENAQTTIAVPINYTGDTKVILTAKTKDTSAPVISSYEGENGTQYGMLTAMANDQETGIAAYTFSTVTNGNSISDTEWIALTSTAGEMKTLTYVADGQPGVYYCYVKDVDGNIAKSSKGIAVAQLLLKDYYQDGQLMDYTRTIVESEAITLPSLTRAGYDFEGWYKENAFVNKVTEYVANGTELSSTVYAKWNYKKIQLDMGETKDYDSLYTGKSYILSGSVPAEYKSVTYQWYVSKEETGTFVALETGKQSSYAVKNVADSGYYRLEVKVMLEGSLITIQSDVISVKIRKVPLTITPNAVTVPYGGIPEYTCEYAGFVNGENENTLGFTIGTMSSDYEPYIGDVGKEYLIKMDGYHADNYSITTVLTNKLTVEPKNVNQTDSQVMVAVEKTSYAYTGSDIEPKITVTDQANTNSQTIAAANYSIMYFNNINVGNSARAVITFQNNYTGSLTITFSITKTIIDPTMSIVEITDWNYGDTPNAPSLKSDMQVGTVTYYYYPENDELQATTDVPTAVGKYYVYAKIDGNANVETIEKTAATAFEIKKRPITITSESASWDFDGNAHFNTNYTVEGEFVGTDSLLNVVVNTTIQNVGEVTNTINYTVSSSTNLDNYEITLVEGTLSIRQKELNIPYNYRWNTAVVGTATWVSVVKAELRTQYELSLYRTEGNSLVDIVTTTDTSYDFTELIHQDAAANGISGYYFTIKAQPFEGVNVTNYKESQSSGHSTSIYTVQVQVEPGDVGIESASINDAESTILLAGESAPITATAKEGFDFATPTWRFKQDVGSDIRLGSTSKVNTTVTVSTTLAHAITVELNPFTSDELPEISAFEAVSAENSTIVSLQMSAQDSQGIAAWAITKESVAPTRDAEWNLLTEDTQVITESVTVEADDVMSAETYYAWIKDSGGNVVGSSKNITLYQIKLDGNGADSAQQMSSILKIQNVTLKLPDNIFTKQGKVFQNWKGENGSIYANGSNYVANKSDTLMAQWTDQQMLYQVDYYYMDMEGNYPADGTPSTSRTFSGGYGADVTSSNNVIQYLQAGMELDTERIETITLTDDLQVLSVYYKRSMYTITYSYISPTGTHEVIEHTDTFRYGEQFHELAKPEIIGYSFVGWVYGESGTTPETMPNKNITATGTFNANSSSYEIHYYEENLGEPDTYTLVVKMDDERESLHATPITVSVSDAKSIEGFTIQGVSMTYGSAGSTSMSQTDLKTTETGEVNADQTQKLHINYYFSRNSYEITLSVWKANRNETDNQIYTHTWREVEYGAEIDPEYYASFEQEKWEDEQDLEGYKLAEYVDWSTGDAPNKMPAGNISVARDYVETAISSYLIEVYFETATPGVYEYESTLTYYKNEGVNITIKNETRPDDNPDDKVVYISDIMNTLPNSSVYTFVPDAPGSVLSGIVTEAESSKTPLTLKVYMERNVMTAKVSYYYYDENGKAILIGYINLNGKWESEYEINPLKVFDVTSVEALGENYVSANREIDNIPAENYNFRNERYVISYSGVYRLNEKNRYPAENLQTVESLSKHYYSVFGTDNDRNYINVYYTKADWSGEHYHLDLQYDATKLKKASGRYSLTATDASGETYYVRVANKADVFEATMETPNQNAVYPGISNTKGEFSYTEPLQLKNGFQEIIFGEGDKQTTYYTKGEEADGRKYVYILDEENQLYYGNAVAFQYTNDKTNKARVGYESIETFLNNYKLTHSDETNDATYDSEAEDAYIRDTNIRERIYNHGTYLFDFEYYDSYMVTYVLDGNVVKTQKYTSGKLVEIEQDLKADIQNGFDIYWYTDGTYKTPATDFKISQNTIIYGRYEKQIIPYHEYVYYQLADVETIGSEKINYITADNLDKVKEGLGYEEITASEMAAREASLNKLVSFPTTTKDTFVNEYGEAKEIDIVTKDYYWQGIIVMKDVEKQCNTYTEVVMNYSSDGGYQLDGFHYDDTNTKNRVRGYCQLTEYNLSVYYARDEFTFTLYKNLSSLSNIGETEIYRYGQRIDISKLTKVGYLFQEWSWSTLNQDGNMIPVTTEEIRPYILEQATQGAITFRMPKQRIYLSAEWSTTDVEKEVTHYFQDITKTYRTDTMEQIRNTSYTKADTVSQNGSNIAATLYYEDSSMTKLLGSSVEAGKYTYYYDEGIVQEGLVQVTTMDLIAVTSAIDAVSEDVLSINDYIFPTKNNIYNMFTFSFLVLLNEKEVETLHEGDSFKFDPASSIDFYYTRNSDYRIREVAKAADGQDSGTTVIGAGSYQYGESVTLKASLAQGYSFMGWYLAKDVFSNYEENMDLDQGIMKTNLDSVEKVSENLSCNVKVTENTDYVAIVKVLDMATPIIRVSGKQEYQYGYNASTENVLNASASFASGTDSANYIAGYQWYEVTKVLEGEALQEVETPIENATAAIWTFPLGKRCGTYTYYCEVTVGRKDNGRTMKFVSEKIQVTVVASEMSVQAVDYEGVYDGMAHSVTINVTNPADPAEYEIYYSSEQPLDQNNYLQADVASTTAPEFSQVKILGGVPTAYTVYYYVHNKNGDYMDIAGEGTVTITPATLSIASKSGYTKEYDASDDVSGDIFTVGTQRYDLAHGNGKYYTISGLKTGDSTAVVLDFDSQFNGTHVDNTTTLTLKNLKIVEINGDTKNSNENYTFQEDEQLVLPATITAKMLDIAWSSQNTFAYDGQEHAPTVDLESTDLPDDGITLLVSGAQTNAGTYTAYAAIAGTDYTTDYQIRSGSSTAFTIAKREIAVAPVSTTTPYLKKPITLTEYQITEGSIVTGQTYEAKSTSNATNVGTYLIQAGNMRIYQGNTEVTDNYQITYGTGTLIITGREIVVSGMKVADKIYDGTTQALIDLSAVKFTAAGNAAQSGVIYGDTISLDATKIKALFVDAGAGNSKSVTLQYDGDVLIGEDVDNYILLAEESQKTTTGKITKKILTITPADATTVYGEDVTFTSEITGFIEVEKDLQNTLVTGEVQYQIQETGKAPVDYTTATKSGSYQIVPVWTALHADNYDFQGADTNATLTVEKRPIQIVGKTVTVSKVYDGTQDAKAAIEEQTLPVYEVQEIAGQSVSGIVNGDTVTLSDYTAEYNTKNVVEANQITISNIEISNENYKLAEGATFTIQGRITTKELSITPVSFTVPYGTKNVTYSAVYEGFVAGESENDAAITGGAVRFWCDYNADDHAYRNAGQYVINVSGFQNSNYAYTFEQGTLTIGQAEITVTADDKEMIYGITELPALTCQFDGLQYETDITEIENILKNLTYHYENAEGNTVSINYVTTAGTYRIIPEVNKLTNTNYTWKAVEGEFVIKKQEITISGVRIGDKIYDGTTAVTSDKIDVSGVTYAGILAQDVSRQGVYVEAEYTNANAGTAQGVSIKATLNDYLSARYLLKEDSQSTATADILPKDLVITAEDKQITYGDKLPEFTVSYEGFVNHETESNLSGTLVCSVPYQKDDPVGRFEITPGGFLNGNYNITYKTGNLDVVAAKLDQVENVNWDEDTPGMANWDVVNAVGNYGAVSYQVSLYHVGASGNENCVVSLEVEATDDPKYNFAEEIRKREGGYYVKVAAQAGLNHAANPNVNDGDESVNGTMIYTSKVSVAYATDDISIAGGSNILVNGMPEYIVIAGEKNIPISATLKNKTGYHVSEWSASSNVITVGEASQIEDVVTTTFELGSNLSSAEDIIITLALQPTAATLKLSTELTKINGEWPVFGYTREEAPVVTTNVAVEAYDNIGVEGYRYTYEWKIRKGRVGEYTMLYGVTTSSCEFPVGYGAADTYMLNCTVVATRIDNGQQIQASILQDKMEVTRSIFTTEVYIDSWKYGQSRSLPYVGRNPGEATVTYYYRTEDTGEWTVEQPTNVGNYQIKAMIDKSDNYAACETEPVSFAITQAQLDTPDYLVMTDASSVPYGMGKWNAVEGPKENNGAADSTSHVDVSYVVVIYYANEEIENDAEGWSVLKTYENITECECDFSEVINDSGIYKFTVQAIATNNGGIAENCISSEESNKHGKLDISAAISLDVNEKVYDGTPIVLRAESTLETGDEAIRIQWYKDGIAIQGATQSEYGVTYMEQNGNYTCSVEVGSGDTAKRFYSAKRQITIQKRQITITSASATKEYDRTPLTAESFEVTSVQKEAVGDVITMDFPDEITDFGAKDNTMTNVKISRSLEEVTKDVTSNYEIHLQTGTLEVNRRNLGNLSNYRDSVELITTLSGTELTELAQVAYRGAVYEPDTVVKYYTAKSQGETLQKGTDYTVSYENNLDAGIATVYVLGVGNYDGVITRQFEITKVPITLTSEDKAKSYDGNPLQSTYDTTQANAVRAIQISKGSLVSGEHLNAVTFTGSITDAGTIENTFGDIVIQNAELKDVTNNYEITKQYGTLSVGRIADKIEITSDLNKVYNGQPADMPTFTRNGSGAVRTRYYEKTGETYQKLTEAPTAAGNYAVRVFADEGGNYLAAVSDYLDFTIDQISIKITLNDAQSAYHETVASLTYKSFEGQIVEGDELNLQLYTEATSESTVGTYPINVRFTENANYDVSITPGTYYIIEASMTYHAQGCEQVYDGETHGIQITVPDTVTIYYATEPLTAENFESVGQTTNLLYQNAGSYQVYFYLYSTNYIDESGVETVHISKADPVFTTSDVTVMYDDQEHGLVVTSSGEAELTYDQTKWITPGEHRITISSAESTNYHAKTELIVFTITKRNITLVANSAEKIFDGKELHDEGYAIEGAGLVKGHIIDEVKIEGSQIQVGSSKNTIGDAIILKSPQTAGEDTDEEETQDIEAEDIENVTEFYDITYVDGVLRVQLAPKKNLESESNNDDNSNAITQKAEEIEEVIMIPDEPIFDDSTYSVGKGQVKVLINSNIGQNLTVYLDSSLEVLERILEPEELEMVKNGSVMEIVFDISFISESLSIEEENILKEGYNQLLDIHPNVQFVSFVNIDVHKKLGINSWKTVTDVKEGIRISFVHEQINPNATYYLFGVSPEESMLYEDQNEEESIITFTLTKLSQLVYVVYKDKTGVIQEEMRPSVGVNVAQNNESEQAEVSGEDVVQITETMSEASSQILQEENTKYRMTESEDVVTQEEKSIPWPIVIVVGVALISGGVLYKKKSRSGRKNH